MSQFLVRFSQLSKLQLFMIYILIVAMFYGSIKLAKSQGYRLFITQSASVDGFVYVASPFKGELQKGQMIVFPLPEATRVKGDVIKEVFAKSGDEITNVDGRIFINGVFELKAKSHSLKGEPLEAITSQVIPDGFVFVAGHMKDSFDSRYERFGLIPEDQIESIGRKVF